jgi:predicted glycogen debranching enzyme
MAARRKPPSAARTVRKTAAGAPKPQDAQPGPPVSFGPRVCAELASAEAREWLVTNGIGGFASGTIAGSATRRYHGLLFAALNPPEGRTLLVGGTDELLEAGGQSYPLATHRWLSGAIAPEGYKTLENFRLEGSIPVWTFRAGPARLEKRIWMRCGENTTFVRYTLVGSDSLPAQAVHLELKVFVNYRDFHGATHAGRLPQEWRMHIDPVDAGVQINAFDAAAPFYLKCAAATCEPQHIWYRDFFFALERERGLDDHEDQLFGAQFRARLEIGRSVTLVFSVHPGATLDGERALLEEQSRQKKVLDAAKPLVEKLGGKNAPSWLPQLILAGDQFLVSRPLADQSQGKSLIAGYHWFGDWGRDTMISLPGLALSGGRQEIAREILMCFSRFVNRGMLPNNFHSGAPGYNTIDAALWYFEAIRLYFAATGDAATLRQLFPVLAEIIQAHLSGTRYNIHVDPTDGLVYGGGPGVQLTWMDAKIGDWVVTPRTGKPVEINALWINALESMAAFAEALHEDPTPFLGHSRKAQASFPRFWNAARTCCFDVLDSPGIGSDASLRPNQIFAVSLPVSPLTPSQQRAVVDTCAAHLLTPFGLRSLAPGEPHYSGVYSGGPRERDASYHQGPVWGWLLGPFALAHFRVYQDPAAARSLLDPLAQSFDRYGLGTLGELFDGDPPHHPRGCISQAWTVAELLRSWLFLKL